MYTWAEFPEFHSAVTDYVTARDTEKALKDIITRMNDRMVSVATSHGGGVILGDFAIKLRRTAYTPKPAPSATTLRALSPSWYDRIASPTFQVRVDGFTAPLPELVWPTTGASAVIDALTDYRARRSAARKDKEAARDLILAFSPGVTSKVAFEGGVTVAVRNGPAALDYPALQAADPELFEAILKPRAAVSYTSAIKVKAADLDVEGDEEPFEGD